jgi:hypothetical protein
MMAPKVRNYINGGATRCVQASFRMVVETFNGGDPGLDFADAVTGYVEGRGTWQFRMLLAFADIGLNALDHELLDVEKFVSDTRGAIFDQTRSAHVTQLIMDETDVEAEVLAATRCLQSPYVEFVMGTPTMADLVAQVEMGRLVMCNVDLQVLEGKPEREGHILLIESIGSDLVIAHDPGPHGSLSRRFDRDLFERSWSSPSPEMANFISVWPRN